MNMKRIFVLVFVVLLLTLILGDPEEVSIIGTPPFIDITWKIQNEETQALDIETQQTTPKTYDIYIESFESGQQVYKPGDKSTVDFTIINGLNVSYNITVDWLYNNTRYHGWNTVSTSIYNTTEPNNKWISWVNIYEVGEWEAHLIVNYSLNNYIFSKDRIIKFRVI